jgi:homoserine O-succinyltransferase/O-acetyltransferase
MPVIIDNDRYSYRLSRHGQRRSRRVKIDACEPAESCIHIGLINNMPDSALERTELQFARLLDAAAGDKFVRLKLYSLPNLPRRDWGLQYLDRCYSKIDDLFKSDLDGVIMTGTEPRAPSLADEPYWGALVDVLDWAEERTVSSIFSCLAAHAAVRHIDGIERRALSEKCFGIFDQIKVSDCALTKGVPRRIRFPHSRWNDIPQDSLISSDYEVLTWSAEAGVDSFVKRRKSLFLFFQGHPEYEPQTLLWEYHRDIRHFLEREKEIYPGMPQRYFDEATIEALGGFRKRALSDRRTELLSDFPATSIAEKVTTAWRAAATSIYRNWLLYISEQKMLGTNIIRTVGIRDPRQGRLPDEHQS